MIMKNICGLPSHGKDTKDGSGSLNPALPMPDIAPRACLQQVRVRRHPFDSRPGNMHRPSLIQVPHSSATAALAPWHRDRLSPAGLSPNCT